MDWVLAYYELLIRLKQWRRLFEIWIHWQNHFFDCGVISFNEVPSIRLLKSPVLVDIFKAMPHSLR